MSVGVTFVDSRVWNEDIVGNCEAARVAAARFILQGMGAFLAHKPYFIGVFDIDTSALMNC